ncbi:MAG: NFACT RNA binding domain-containing protein [archaeon]
MEQKANPSKFRLYVTSTGLGVFAGKNSEQNDKLVSSAKRNDILMHTEKPGSPFCNLEESPSNEDISEAAVFCARYSQDWRDNKKDVTVQVFRKSDMDKDVSMKSGTWGVKRVIQKIKVKRGDIERFNISKEDIKREEKK